MFSIVSSCTIHKKLHSNGYHIEWKSFNRNIQNDEQIQKESLELEKVDLAERIDLEKSDSSSSEINDTIQQKLNEKAQLLEDNFKNKISKRPNLSIDVENIYTNQKNKKNYISDIFIHNATSYAFLAHLGIIIVLIGFILILNASYSTILGSLVVLIGAILNIFSTILGLFEIIVGDFGSFPVFAIITISFYVIAYSVFLLIEFGL